MSWQQGEKAWGALCFGRHRKGETETSGWNQNQLKLGKAAPPTCPDTRANQENIRWGRTEEKPSFLSARNIVSTERRREMAAVN